VSRSRRMLLPGAAVIGIIVFSSVLPGQRARAAATAPSPAAIGADACGLSFPSSHNLRVISVSSGPGVIVTVASGAYSFNLSRYTGFNGSVRQATGMTPPAGDSVAPFAFGVPGGHYYIGLTNVLRQGTQDHVCLRGIAYRDLGNGPNADQAPPVAVTLDGTIAANYARVDLYVGATHYYVYGRPRTR